MIPNNVNNTRMSSEILANWFDVTYRVLRLQTDGLTHQDSLLQLPFRGNCLNWVVGHILNSYGEALALLDEAQVWSKEEREPYLSESTPITPENNDIALPFEKLLAYHATAQERLMAALARATPDDLAVAIGSDTANSVGNVLQGLFFHITYHTGQTELLRQLAGKDDKVV
jgi:hypothetical protein